MSSFAEYQSNQIIKEKIISQKENESKTDIKNAEQKYSILSFLKNNKNMKEKLNSNSNSNSYNSVKKYNYAAYPINKFDERTTSLGNISYFDLECQEEKDFNSSFNSLEISFEENNEEIRINLKVQNELDEAEYLFELNKEYEEIEKEILNIKN
jgi:hypothetical protein